MKSFVVFRVLIFALVFSALMFGVNASSLEPADFSTVSAPNVSTSTGLQEYANAVSPPAITNAEIDDELKELARSLSHDPEKIGEFVYNHIDSNPLFGLGKGALGAYYDGNGTPFDQAELFAHLLRVDDPDTTANEATQVRYVFGTVTLSGTQFTDTFGVTTGTEAEQLMANGGTPADVSGTSSITSVSMLSIWCEYFDGSSWVSFVPFVKSRESAPLNNIGSLITHNSSGLVSTAGGLSGIETVTVTAGLAPNYEDIDIDIPWVSGYSSANMATHLNSEAVTFLGVLENQFSEHTIEMVLDEKEIKQKFNGDHLDNTINVGLTGSETWVGEIPDILRTKVNISALTIDYDTYLDEIYTERLTFRWVNYGFGTVTEDSENSDGVPVEDPALVNRLHLYHGHRHLSDIDENFVHSSTPINNWPFLVDYHQGTSSQPQGPGYFPVTVSVDHPYTANSGAYADESVIKYANYGTLTEVFVGTQGLSSRHARRYERVANSDPRRKRTMMGRVCFTTKDVNEAYVCGNDNHRPYYGAPFIFAKELKIEKDFEWRRWNAALETVSQITGAIADVKIVQHHSIGIIAGGVGPENEHPSAGISFDIDTKISISDPTGNQTNINNVALTMSTMATMLEQLSLANLQTKDQYDQLYDTGYNAASVSFGGEGSTGSAISAMAETFKTNTNKVYNIGLDNSEPAIAVSAYSVSMQVMSALLTGYDSQAKAEINLDLISHDVLVPKSYPSGNAHSWLIAHNDGNSSVAHKIRELAGGTGAPYRKGSANSLPGIQDIKAEDFKNQRTKFGENVDLKTGQFSLTLPVNISDGIGQYPDQLSFQLSYDSTSVNTSPFGRGWNHNHNIYLKEGSSLMEVLGETSPNRAATTFIAIKALLELTDNNDKLESVALQALVADWWAKGITKNIATISNGLGGGQFYRLVDGTYDAPPLSNSSLTKTTSANSSVHLGDTLYEMVTIDGVKTSFREVIIQGDIGTPNNASVIGDALRSAQEFNKYLVQDISFPAGKNVNYTYAPVTGNLTTVTNHLGRILAFEYIDIQTADDCFQLGLNQTSVLDVQDQLHCNDSRASFNLLQGVKNAQGHELQFGLNESATTQRIIDNRQIDYYYDPTTLQNIFHVFSNLDYVEVVPGDSLLACITHSFTGLFGERRDPHPNFPNIDRYTYRAHERCGSGADSSINLGYDGFKIASVRWFDSYYTQSPKTPLIDIDFTDIGNLKGRVKKVRDADGVETEYCIGEFHSMTMDALGNATSYYYDKEGRISQIVEPEYTEVP